MKTLEIAKAYGITSNHVVQISTGKDWSHIPEGICQVNHTEVIQKLNLDKANTIRSMYASGSYTQYSISKIYNVSEHTIWEIINGRRYNKNVC